MFIIYCWWGLNCLLDYSDSRSSLFLDAMILAHEEMPIGNTQWVTSHAWPSDMYWHNVRVIWCRQFWGPDDVNVDLLIDSLSFMNTGKNITGAFVDGIYALSSWRVRNISILLMRLIIGMGSGRRWWVFGSEFLKFKIQIKTYKTLLTYVLFLDPAV